MFNPFKKKDEFKLDEDSLLSLGESKNMDENLMNTNNNSNFNSNPISDTLSPNNSFNSLANTTPNFSNNTIPMENNQNIENDLIKTKIETIESKLNLLDNRIISIDNKIDLIYKILLEEINDSTKEKLNINSINRTLRNKLN